MYLIHGHDLRLDCSDPSKFPKKNLLKLRGRNKSFENVFKDKWSFFANKNAGLVPYPPAVTNHLDSQFVINQMAKRMKKLMGSGNKVQRKVWHTRLVVVESVTTSPGLDPPILMFTSVA